MKKHTWHFPLPRTHTGVPLGNGRLGVLVWGDGPVLRITLGRGDWWDHRGAKSWTDQMRYDRIRPLLESGDESALREIFAESDTPGISRRSTLLPLGRFELRFPESLRLETATLHMDSGLVRVVLKDAASADRPATLDLRLAMDRPVLAVKLGPDCPPPIIDVAPAWYFVGAALQKVGYKEPEILAATDDGMHGWVQRTPADDHAAALAQYDADDGLIWMTAALDASDPLARARQVLTESRSAGLEKQAAASSAWWRRYWSGVPQVEHPNARLGFLYWFGLYKFGGLTTPGAVAAGLQGPWLEEYQLPPWSGDYHFNINVQMCYWPAYQAGLWDHLAPLFDMVEGWLPKLRENARKFVGIDDGYLLPHAVDDEAGIIGSFWTGTIDHACTAWVGKMMYDHWLYTGDVGRLRRVTFPFLVGAMRVYEEMLERQPDGSLGLPVSVSPEYRGAAMNAWGRNASFQLAACRWLVRALEESADVLGETPREAWRDVLEHLPEVALIGEAGREEIALWEGTPLEESHRHHSHLAGICPFDTVDPQATAWREIARRSHDRWIAEGMGLWSGWCMPWAAMLQHRFDHPEAADLYLEIWERVFTNEGHGTLHDVNFPGFSLMGGRGATPSRRNEKMQMDAGMAAVAAIMDGLAHTRQGVLHVFTGVPKARGACRFDGIWIERGLRISARRDDRATVASVAVEAPRGGTVRLSSPWVDDPRGPVLEAEIPVGGTHRFDPPA